MSIPIGQPAIGTLLKIANEGSPLIFNTIANVGDLSGPALTAKMVDVTSHSNANPWTQMIATLLTGGTVSFPLFFIPSSAGSDNQPNTPFGHDGTNGLLAVFTQRQLRQYSITFPDAVGTTYYFQAYISKFNFDEKVADVVRATVDFTVTGEPTFS